MAETHKPENGWKSPADRLEEAEETICRIDKKGCMLHEPLLREVGSVRKIGFIMLGMQCTILLAILALIATLSGAKVP